MLASCTTGDATVYDVSPTNLRCDLLCMRATLVGQVATMCDKGIRELRYSADSAIYN